MAKLPDWMYGFRLPGVDISQLPGWKLLKEPKPETQEKEKENEDDNSKERN